MRIRSSVWKAILILNLIKLNQNTVIEHVQEVGLFVSNLFYEEQWFQPGIKPFFPPKSRKEGSAIQPKQGRGAGTELNLARDKKKEKMKAKEILVPLLNAGRHLVAHEIELMPPLRPSFRNLRTLTQEEKFGTRKTSLGEGITSFSKHLKDRISLSPWNFHGLHSQVVGQEAMGTN